MRTTHWLVLGLSLPFLSACGARPEATPEKPKQEAKADTQPVPPANPAKPEELFRGRWELVKDAGKEPRIEWIFLTKQPPADKGFRIEVPRRAGSMKPPAGYFGPLVLVTEGAKEGFDPGRGAAHYKFLGGDTLELSDEGMVFLIGGGKPPVRSMKLKVKVSGDELTLTDEKGGSEKYRRLPPLAASVKITGLPFCCAGCPRPLKANLEKIAGFSDLNINVRGREVTFKLKDQEDLPDVGQAIDAAGMHGQLVVNDKPVLEFEPVGTVIGGGAPKPKKEIVIKGLHACCGGCQERITEAVGNAKIALEGDGPLKTLRITGDNLDENKIVTALWKAGYKVSDRK